MHFLLKNTSKQAYFNEKFINKLFYMDNCIKMIYNKGSIDRNILRRLKKG